MVDLPVVVKVVNSVADVRLLPASFTDDQLYLRGYYATSARGGGFLYRDGLDMVSDDDGFLVFVTIVAGEQPVRWKRRLDSGPVDAYMAGAKGAGYVDNGKPIGDDDGPALRRLFDYFKTTIADGGATAVESILRIGGGQFCTDLSQDLTSQQVVTDKSLHEAGMWSIDGTGATLLGRCGGKPVLDMTDSRFGTVLNLQIYGSSKTGEVPSCGIRIGRIEDNRAANQMQLHRVRTDGEFLIAGVHNIASEQLYTLGCEFGNEAESQDAYGYCADGINSQDWALPEVVSSSSGSPIIPGISKDTQAVVRVPGHQFAPEDKVMLTGVKDMTIKIGNKRLPINNKVFVVGLVTLDTFQLLDADTTLSVAYTSGGRAFKQLHGSDFVTTTLSPWIQHSFKGQTHIALRAQCARGGAAILETGDSRHSYQAHTSCGFYNAVGAEAVGVTSIANGPPAVFAVPLTTVFSDGNYVFATAMEGGYQSFQGRIFIIANKIVGIDSITFTLTDLHGAIAPFQGTVFGDLAFTLQNPQAGVGMRMVISDTGIKQCDYKLHHEPGGRANATRCWATVESMEALRDGAPAGGLPVELRDSSFSEIVAHSQFSFIDVDPVTVSTVTLDAGGVHVTGFRERFGGESLADKLLTPPGLWSLRGADLILGEPAADPSKFAGFSGRYYVRKTDTYREQLGPATIYGLLRPETTAWLEALKARGGAQPAGLRTLHYDALIASLIAAGVWQALPGLYLFAAHDATAAQVNLVAPSSPVLALSGTAVPTFTADRGYTGTGSGWLDTGIAVSSATNYALNSACMGVVARTNVNSDNQRDVGASSSNSAFLNTKAAGGRLHTRANDSTTNNAVTVGSTAGFSSWSRSAATGYAQYVGGGAAASPTAYGASTASVALPSGNFAFLQGGGGNFSTRQLAAGFFGAGLTTAQMNALYTALKTYLVAVGAWV